jgi:hypothetical protein
VRIKNTLEIGDIEVSESLLNEVRADPNLDVLSEAVPFSFDVDGNLEHAEKAAAR